MKRIVLPARFLLGFMIGLLFSPALLMFSNQCDKEPFVDNYREAVVQNLEYYEEVINPLHDYLSENRWTCRGDGCLDDTDIRRLAFEIVSEADETGIPVDVLLGVVMVENPWLDSTAVSFAGAVGIMQVMPNIHVGNFPECGDQNVRGISDNVCMGSRILKMYMDREQRRAMHSALLAYNGCRGGDHCVGYSSKVLGLLELEHFISISQTE